MQISSIQSNPYITATTNSNTNKNQSNYNKLSIDEMQKIPFEEFKNNLEEIQTRYQTIQEEEWANMTDKKVDIIRSLSVLNDKISLASNFITDNKTFNKATFEAINNIQPDKQCCFLDEVLHNMADYAGGKSVQASFMVGDNVHVTEPLTKQQMNRINFDDFLSTMISNFGNDVATSGGSVKQQYQGIVDGYSLLKQNYDFQKSEPIYA